MGRGGGRKRLRKQFGCDCTKWLGAVRLTELWPHFLHPLPRIPTVLRFQPSIFLLISHYQLHSFQGNNFRLLYGDLSAIFTFQWPRYFTLATVSNTSWGLGSVFLNHSAIGSVCNMKHLCICHNTSHQNFVFYLLTLLSDVSKDKVRSLAVTPSPLCPLPRVYLSPVWCAVFFNTLTGSTRDTGSSMGLFC